VNDINLYEKIPKDPFPVRITPFMCNGYKFPVHWHEHTEIHFFFKGIGRLRYGEEYFELKEGDCVIINGNELHGGGASPTGACSYLCIIIPPAFFELNHIIFEKVVRDEYVSELIGKIYEKNLTRSPLDILELKALMYLLVSYLIKEYTYKSLPETVYTRHFSKLNKIHEATNYISKNYDKPLTTKMLAELAHLSEGYFCQIFKEVTGKTAMEYINSFRIDKAEKMLHKTDMTVTEVAFCCGFDDANYFSRMYKKIKGENPQAARHLKEKKI